MIDGAQHFIPDPGHSRLEHPHIADDRLALGQGLLAARDGLRVDTQSADKGDVGRGMDHAPHDVPCSHIGQSAVAHLPVDHLIAAPLDGRSVPGQILHRREQRRQPFHQHVLQGGIVLQRWQQLQHDLRKTTPAVLQQSGNIDGDMLSGIEKIRQQQEARQTSSGQHGHLIGDVRPGDREESRQHLGTFQA